MAEVLILTGDAGVMVSARPWPDQPSWMRQFVRRVG